MHVMAFCFFPLSLFMRDPSHNDHVMQYDVNDRSFIPASYVWVFLHRGTDCSYDTQVSAFSVTGFTLEMLQGSI